MDEEGGSRGSPRGPLWRGGRVRPLLGGSPRILGWLPKRPPFPRGRGAACDLCHAPHLLFIYYTQHAPRILYIYNTIQAQPAPFGSNGTAAVGSRHPPSPPRRGGFLNSSLWSGLFSLPAATPFHAVLHAASRLVPRPLCSQMKYSA